MSSLSAWLSVGPARPERGSHTMRALPRNVPNLGAELNNAPHQRIQRELARVGPSLRTVYCGPSPEIS
jgi:hypothetical protein